jgi:ATP-binding cassette subfamily F protein uup
VAAQDRDVQKALARLERQIDKLRAREVTLHDALAAHATDFEKVTDLHAELRVVEGEREQLEEEWLDLAT